MNTKFQDALAALKVARREESEAAVARLDAERRAEDAREKHRAAKTKLDNAKMAFDRAVDEATRPCS